MTQTLLARSVPVVVRGPEPRPPYAEAADEYRHEYRRLRHRRLLRSLHAPRGRTDSRRPKR